MTALPAAGVPPIDTTSETPARASVRDDSLKPKFYDRDCRDVLPTLDADSVHLAVTDPPYFLDRLDDGWSHERIERSRRHAAAVGGLPIGMKFDPEQGRRLQEFLTPIAAEVLRVLKPGGFLLMFAAPRLSHRAAVAIEDAGFEVRDVLAWRFTAKAQFKAFTVDHFVKRRADMTEGEKAEALRRLGGRRTPQLRPQFEAIVLAQKPRDGTFVDNWLAHETGLIDAAQKLNGHMPETIMTVEKEARNQFNGHLTAKPVKLIEHLIRVFSAAGQTVLDPFVGSGTTCLAARRCGRHSIGIDVDPNYIEIARRRWAGQT